jgi:PIN domain nuclease of toxin-antitoxin system
MNLLLDRHVLLWWITDASELSAKARECISNGSNMLFWSAASSWEVAVKYALGRLPLPEVPVRQWDSGPVLALKKEDRG